MSPPDIVVHLHRQGTLPPPAEHNASGGEERAPVGSIAFNLCAAVFPVSKGFVLYLLSMGHWFERLCHNCAKVLVRVLHLVDFPDDSAAHTRTRGGRYTWGAYCK